jgi:acid phosphatase
MTRGRAVAMTLLLLLAAACTSTSGSGTRASSGTPAGTSAAAPTGSTGQSGGLPTPEHVVVVLFENEDAGSVVGAPDAPYLSSLAASGATFTDAHGVTHPSQPNYLALFSGSTQGVTDDSCPQTFDGPNLAGQLLDAGKTFVGYSEDLPKAGSTTCEAGDYARKHNPWVDFPALPAEVNQPYTALPADFADLPTVAVVVPNLCNDMHDCGVPRGDAWAKAHLAAYVTWAKAHDSLLIVTFDENEGSRGNHIATFFVGPMVAAGPTSQHIDHYSVLRTLEDMYGLPPLGVAASRQPITGIWTTG